MENQFIAPESLKEKLGYKLDIYSLLTINSFMHFINFL